MNNMPKHKEGSIIVTALLLVVSMATILTVVLLVILNAVKSTRTYSSGLQSQYAADAGIERGLYYAMLARNSKHVTAKQVEAKFSSQNDQPQFELLGTEGIMYFIDARVDDNNGIDVKNVKVNQTVQLDVYAEDSTNGYALVPLSTNQQSQVNVVWEEDPSCDPASSRVEISLVRWSPTLWQDFESITDVQSEYAVQCMINPNNPQGPDQQNVVCSYQVGLDANYLYKVRVRPLNCSIAYLHIEANSNGQNRMSNKLNITGYGISGRQTIFARGTESVWNPSLLGYYNYVVFSDEQVTK